MRALCGEALLNGVEIKTSIQPLRLGCGVCEEVGGFRGAGGGALAHAPFGGLDEDRLSLRFASKLLRLFRLRCDEAVKLGPGSGQFAFEKASALQQRHGEP